jgi:hypothetical protein
MNARTGRASRSPRRPKTFAGCRLETDTHVLQELTSAKAPVEVWNAW